MLKRLILRHPLAAFFVITFAGSWIAMLPLVLARNGLGLLPYSLPEIGLVPLGEWFAIPASLFGPTLASFTVIAITAGRAGVLHLLQRYLLWAVGLRWYLLVIVGVPLTQLVCSSVLLGVAPLTEFVRHWPLFFTTYLPNILITAAAVQIWEEGGWSGFAVPALQQRFGAWRMALILGPLWALFHLPFFFVPGQIFDQKVDAMTMVVQMGLLMILAVFIRIIMTWVFNNTKGSVLLAILLHSALDASNSASDYIKHLLSQSQITGYSVGASLLLPVLGALLVLIFTKGRLSFKSNVTRDQEHANELLATVRGLPTSSVTVDRP
jgi:membrane protease YdiL (CAAX protease family)